MKFIFLTSIKHYHLFPDIEFYLLLHVIGHYPYSLSVYLKMIRDMLYLMVFVKDYCEYMTIYTSRDQLLLT